MNFIDLAFFFVLFRFANILFMIVCHTHTHTLHMHTCYSPHSYRIRILHTSFIPQFIQIIAFKKKEKKKTLFDFGIGTHNEFLWVITMNYLKFNFETHLWWGRSKARFSKYLVERKKKYLILNDQWVNFISCMLEAVRCTLYTSLCTSLKRRSIDREKKKAK